MGSLLRAVISVNDHSERDITKRFEGLLINWPIVENKLQVWSHLLRVGKRLRISVSLNYIESGKMARTAGRGGTATQLAERDARLDEQVVSRGLDIWGTINKMATTR